MNSKSIASLAKRKAETLVHISIAHLAPSRSYEVIVNKKASFDRLQNYVFSQDFYMIIAKDNVKRERQKLDCIRHKKSTRNWRKLNEQDIKKRFTAMLTTNCKYHIFIVFSKRENQ